jgi:hypothetical protein
MTQDEIEHMWKVASNNPNHDTNWHDPVVVAFANLVAKHTLLNIDPSSFMSFQEGVEVGRMAEREACAKVCEDYGRAEEMQAIGNDYAEAIRARGQA